jgi:hypothetical protein
MSQLGCKKPRIAWVNGFVSKAIADKLFYSLERYDGLFVLIRPFGKGSYMGICCKYVGLCLSVYIRVYCCRLIFWLSDRDPFPIAYPSCTTRPKVAVQARTAALRRRACRLPSSPSEAEGEQGNWIGKRRSRNWGIWVGQTPPTAILPYQTACCSLSMVMPGGGLMGDRCIQRIHIIFYETC